MAIRVNGELIGDEHFHAAFLELSGGRIPQQVQQDSPLEFQNLRQQAEAMVLREVLLHQFALAEKITVSPQEVAEELRSTWGSAASQWCGAGVTGEMLRRVTLRKAEQLLTRHVPRPDRQQVAAVYRGKPSAFTLPERWNVSHIVKFAEDEGERQQARDTLNCAAEELLRGKPFAKVAERHSDCKGNGGLLGWLSRGSMVAEFEAHVFPLPRRAVSAIFSTPFGLHLALVNEYRPAGLQPFDEIRSDLARQIFEDRRRSVLDQAAHDLYRRAQIEVVDEPQRHIAAGERSA